MTVLDFRSKTWQPGWGGLPAYLLQLLPDKTLQIPMAPLNAGNSPGGFNLAIRHAANRHAAKPISINLVLSIQNPAARGNDFVQQIASQKADPTFADVTLVCEETEIPCHRVILAARSELFKMMLSNNNFKEGITHRVEVGGMSLTTLMAMLSYIYTNDFTPEESNLRELFTAADMYKIQGLAQKCERYMRDTLSVENAAGYFLTSHLHLPTSKKLNEAAKKFIADNFQDVKKTRGWVEVKKNSDALEAVLEFSTARSELENPSAVPQGSTFVRRAPVP